MNKDEVHALRERLTYCHIIHEDDLGPYIHIATDAIALLERYGEDAQDAKRYRWLRDKCGRTESADGTGNIGLGIHWEAFQNYQPSFDVAVDAAMSEVNNG